MGQHHRQAIFSAFKQIYVKGKRHKARGRYLAIVKAGLQNLGYHPYSCEMDQ